MVDQFLLKSLIPRVLFICKREVIVRTDKAVEMEGYKFEVLM